MGNDTVLTNHDEEVLPLLADKLYAMEDADFVALIASMPTKEQLGVLRAVNTAFEASRDGEVLQWVGGVAHA